MVLNYEHFMNSNKNTYINKKDDKTNKNIFDNRILPVENNNKLAKVGFINFSDEKSDIVFDKSNLSNHINKYL